MKKLLLLILLSSFALGQSFTQDTIMSNNNPASIIRIGNNKIYVAQNKEKQTPYIKQKDSSFLSNGVPRIEIKQDLKPVDKNPEILVNEFFNKMKLNGKSAKEILQIDDKKVFVGTQYLEKEKKIFKGFFYPLKDRFIVIYVTMNYNSEDDRFDTDKAINEMFESGFMVLEDYYLYRKV